MWALIPCILIHPSGPFSILIIIKSQEFKKGCLEYLTPTSRRFGTLLQLIKSPSQTQKNHDFLMHLVGVLCLVN